MKEESTWKPKNSRVILVSRIDSAMMSIASIYIMILILLSLTTVAAALVSW